LRPLVERALEGERISTELDLRLGDDVRHFTVDLVPDVGDAETRGALYLATDLTDRIELERERDEALHELRRLTSELEEENVSLKEAARLHTEHPQIVGGSDALIYVLHRIDQVAEADTSVLIEGETGVGKELVAEAVHHKSRRKGHTFVRLNCATLPDALAESELFGHEAGAFTDARKQRIGRFELAHRGTLFLDEIAELPPALQAKLLRVLESGAFERVGSSVTRRSDFRLIAATNRDLRREVERGSFREDLFYRLHVYTITVPPLRERQDDISLLVRHFLPRIAATTGRRVETVPQGVMKALRDHSWPGNVRELRNVLESAVLASPDNSLRLPPSLLDNGTSTTPSTAAGKGRTLSEVELACIVEALEECRGQVGGAGGAAERLGLNPSTLRSRLKKLDLDPLRYRWPRA
jgi:transcriptional regulator with GAF, ATPase, and Fis domain